MKKYITIIAIIICGFANAQTGYLVQPAKWKFIKPQWLDSGLWIKNINKNTNQNQYLIRDSITGKTYYDYLRATKLIGNLSVSNFNSGTNASSSTFWRGDGVWGDVTGATYTAGRGLTLNSNVFRLDTSLKLTWTANKTIFNSAPLATSQYGLVSLGSGAFDGSTSGFFTGNSDGTVIAGNFATGYMGNGIDLQYHTTNANDQFVGYSQQNKTNTNVFTIKTVNGGTYLGNANSNGSSSLGLFYNFGWMYKKFHIGTNYYTPNASLLVSDAPTASANYGLVSLGSGAFDGATSGFFTGSASGTCLAMNMASGYAGDLMNLQIGGNSKLKVDNKGNETTKNGVTSGVLFTQTATATVANTTTETTLVSTGSGSVTLPADFFEVGKSIIIHGEGIHSAQSNPNITIRIKIGGTTYLTTGAVQSGNSTDAYFEIRGTITCRTTGSSGTVFAQGYYVETGASDNHFGMANTTTQTINTTTSNTIDITAEWDTAYTNNSIRLTNLIIEAK